VPAQHHREINAGRVDAHEAAQVEGGTHVTVMRARGLHTRGLTLLGLDQLLLSGSQAPPGPGQRRGADMQPALAPRGQCRSFCSRMSRALTDRASVSSKLCPCQSSEDTEWVPCRRGRLSDRPSRVVIHGLPIATIPVADPGLSEDRVFTVKWIDPARILQADNMPLRCVTPNFSDAGFLLPVRNDGLLSWCLAHDLRVV
jgi:hypothetical protein